MEKNPEGLGVNSEESNKNVDTDRLEVLTEMSNKFDSGRDRGSARHDKPRDTEEPKLESSRTVDAARREVLATLPERQEGLSPKDAANEYLSLLDEISQDFSNPQYDNDRPGGVDHYGHNITTELGRKYSDDPHYRWLGYNGTEAGVDDKTMLRIAMADEILDGEIRWRGTTNEEATAINDDNQQADQELANLNAEYSRKSRLGKFFGRKRYEKAKAEINGKRRRFPSDDANECIARGLAYAYDETGLNSYGGSFPHYQMVDNEALNRRFFGLDNPERAKKIERAIELRRKYEAEWTKED